MRYSDSRYIALPDLRTRDKWQVFDNHECRQVAWNMDKAQARREARRLEREIQ